jgi:hypothetical protein
MARTRTAKHPKPEQIKRQAEADGAQAARDILAAEPPPPPANDNQPPIKKADAIRAALAAGLDSPGDIEGFLKSHYGIEMPRQMISSYKAQQKARDQKKAGGEEPARKPRSSSPAPRSGNGEVDIIEALEALKPLVKELGPEKIKRLVDVLG